MCPDDQMLSVYYDGELPSPWKEKMEAHLGSCAPCRARVERFRGTSQVLNAAAPLNLEAAQERVWQRLRPWDRGIWGRKPRSSFWGRTITIPLPAAAGAAAALGIVLFIALARQSAPVPQNQNQDPMAATGMIDLQGIVPVSNMNEVLHYLGNQDTADIVIIRLPESRSFSSAGEPTMLKAADYSRRTGTP